MAAQKVRATQKGFYDGAIRPAGEVFALLAPEDFSAKWMEPESGARQTDHPTYPAGALDPGRAAIDKANTDGVADRPQTDANAPAIPPGGAPAPGESTDPRDDVEIPANWESLPWQTKVKLAHELGAGKDVNTKDEAEAAVRDELERRAAK